MKNQFLRHFLPVFATFAAVFTAVNSTAAETSSAQLLVNQWIRQSEDGSITGRIMLPQADGTATAVYPAVVGLADAKGDSRVEKTDENGEFTFRDVEPGVYTVLTRGAKDVCAIVAVHVLGHADEKAAGFSSAIEVSAGRVDFSAVNSNLIRYLPPRQFGEGIASVDNVDVSAISGTVATAAGYRVLQTNGGMVGQIYGAGSVGNALSPSREANVFVFRDGIEIERMTTDGNGRFEVPYLEPGIYSLMVVGNSGSGLVGFELVGENARTFASQGGVESFVAAAQSGIATQFVLQLAPSDGIVDNFQSMGTPDGSVLSDELVSEQVIGESIVDGGFGSPMGGGFAGGAGGGGGIGGSGGLLGLAAVGGAVAAAVAAGTSGGDRVIVVRPATPAVP